MKRFMKSAVYVMVGFVGLAQAATADITRGCSGTVNVEILDGNANNYVLIGKVEGKGSCKNSLQANECRRKARSEINHCYLDMWQNRQNNSIPPRCRSLLSGSSRSGAKLAYEGIMPISQPERLSARAARSVCCYKRPHANKLSLLFYGVVTGDQKCAKYKVGNNKYQEDLNFGKYEMNCAGWRSQGICE